MKVLRIKNSEADKEASLEPIRDIYTEKSDIHIKSNETKVEENADLTESNKIHMLCEEMIKAYNIDRIKTLNLLKAWKRFYKEDKKE